MRSRLLSALVTAAVLAAGVGAYFVLRPDTATYSVTADFEQTPNLFAGGRVMVRGVKVGTITDVEPRPDAVRVTMEIEEGVEVPADAIAGIVPITVIADRYIQLFPAYAGGSKLADGDHIPLDRSRIPAELDDVLTQLKGLLSALEPKKPDGTGPLARLVDSLDGALDGRSQNLADALDSSASVLQNLADADRDITEVIQNLNDVFLALANRSSQIVIVNERLQLVTEALVADQDNLEGTIENLAFFSEEAAGLLDESGDEIGRAFKNLASVLRKVNAQQDDLLAGTIWNNVVSQGVGATNAAGKGLYAYSGRQVDPSQPGAEYNYRIDTRDTIACERIGALIESFKVLNPFATPEQLRNQLMVFFPIGYQDDLAFLVDQLLPLCSILPGTTSLSPAAADVVRGVAASVGEKQFAEMLARWYLSPGSDR